MTTLSGYRVIQALQSDPEITVFRALRDADRALVIVKALLLEQPTIKEIARFRQEYEITN